MTKVELQTQINEMIPGSQKDYAQNRFDSEDFSAASWWVGQQKGFLATTDFEEAEKIIDEMHETEKKYGAGITIPRDALRASKPIGEATDLNTYSDGRIEVTVSIQREDYIANQIYTIDPNATECIKLGDPVAVNSEGLAVKANVIDMVGEFDRIVQKEVAGRPDITTYHIIEIDHWGDENKVTAREVCAYATPQPILIDGEPVEIKWPRYDAPYFTHKEAAQREMISMIQRVYREFPICEQSGLPVEIKITGDCNEWFFKGGKHSDGTSWEFTAYFSCGHCRA